jgi:hypothetical protein
MTTNIKITELPEIAAANIAVTAMFPLVRMDIVETEKGTLGNIGNAIMNGAGSTFTRAANANVAYTVANAAQPAITSVGTLISLDVTGNVLAGNVYANSGIIGSTSLVVSSYAKTTAIAVGSLVAAATAGAGARSFVSDGNLVASGNFGAVIGAGGSNTVPVYSDGTNWRIG